MAKPPRWLPCPFVVKSLKMSSLKPKGQNDNCWMTFVFFFFFFFLQKGQTCYQEKAWNVD